MISFEDGVLRYQYAYATIRVHFPVNLKGDADVRCTLCDQYIHSRRMCGINKAVCEYPDRYIGSACPLIFEEGDDGQY